MQLTAVIILVILHAPDGSEIRINSDQITSLRSPSSIDPHKTFSHKAHCMVSLTDGKFVAVTERCAEIQKMLESTK